MSPERRQQVFLLTRVIPATVQLTPKVRLIPNLRFKADRFTLEEQSFRGDDCLMLNLYAVSLFRFKLHFFIGKISCSAH